MSTSPRRIALLLEYDGGRYHGFQVQANALTVQGVMETALTDLLGEDVRLKGAGRTDTGVHAVGQVATFLTTADHEPATFMRALNARLPEDVTVVDACEVDPDFDARRHALRRWYRYVIVNRPSPSPLLRQRAAWVRGGLDVAAMDGAARLLEGRHDLASFSAVLSQPMTTVRGVFRAEVSRVGEFVVFDMEAEAFLPQQVRRTAGVLLDVGRGACGPQRVADLLANPAIGRTEYAAPPHGLYLMQVTYPEGAVSFGARTVDELVPFALHK